MEPQFEHARAFVFAKLNNTRDFHLYYHGIHHTRDDVLPATERLGEMVGLTNENMLLLRTAALYHDVGCVEDYFNHEARSIHIAQAILPHFGYTPGQIEVISDLIWATKLPQKPGPLLQELICDADLDSLGRDDFFEISHSLRREIKHYGSDIDICTWYRRQVSFLEAHHYLTGAARRLRNAGKQKNIAELKEVLACGEKSGLSV